jgi:hypothetical protein
MTTILILAALAAPGDTLAVYVTAPEPDIVIDTTERQKLADAVAAIFPGIVKANLTLLDCFRPKGANVAQCKGSEETVPTDADLLDRVLEGKARNRTEKPHDAAEVALSVLRPFVDDAFGDVSTVYQVKAWRDPESPAIIRARVWRLKVEPLSVWRAAYDAGQVLITMGKVVE